MNTEMQIGYRDISPAAVASAGGRYRIIDVREPHELTGELGHIRGVESVPLATLEAAAEGWNRSQEIVVVCRSGGRSARAASQLASAGFTDVMNMTGGMLAWNAANLPITR